MAKSETEISILHVIKCILKQGPHVLLYCIWRFNSMIRTFLFLFENKFENNKIRSIDRTTHWQNHNDDSLLFRILVMQCYEICGVYILNICKTSLLLRV